MDTTAKPGVCGARTRNGAPCSRVPGWGTPHKGEGRCKVHGGLGGAPKGSKNALKHGLYEGIHHDLMSEEERGLAAGITGNAFESAKETFVLLTIRERRMLARIAELANVEFVQVQREYAKGYNVKGAVDMETVTERNTLELIASIEDALNTVAARKAKTIDQMHTYAQPEQRRMLDGLMSAIGRSLGVEESDDEHG